jgi:hypothetical protein
VEERYTHELLASVMVHIAILAHHAVCRLLGHSKTQIEHIPLGIMIYPYLPCRELQEERDESLVDGDRIHTCTPG